MTCNVCNQLIEPDERQLPKNKEWYPESETWYINSVDGKRFDIIYKYDCGYASDIIKGINFCPMCGRKLINE